MEQVVLYLTEAYIRFNRLPEKAREKVVAYAAELDCLHEELAFMRFDLEGAVTLQYKNSLDLKRLGLTYHENNLYLRIHAYREKVLQFLNCLLELDVTESDSKLPGKVLEELYRRRLTDLIDLLRRFYEDPILSEALQRRRLFVHRRARREPGWPTLSAEQRVLDRIMVRDEIDEFDRVTDLDRFHNALQERLSYTHRRLNQLRRELLLALRKMGYWPGLAQTRTEG